MHTFREKESEREYANIVLEMCTKNPHLADGSTTVTLSPQRSNGLPVAKMIQMGSTNNQRWQGIESSFSNNISNYTTDQHVSETFRELYEPDSVPAYEEHPRAYRELIGRPYETLNKTHTDVVYTPTTRSSMVPIHFIGHNARFNMCMRRYSPRVAPFRTKTHRNCTRAMETTHNILSSIGVRPLSYAVPGAIELRLRCLWLGAAPGGGIVRYSVPPLVPLRDVLADFCGIVGLPYGRCTMGVLDMDMAVGLVRTRAAGAGDTFSTPGMSMGSGEPGQLADALTIINGVHSCEKAGVHTGDTVDVLLEPHTGDVALGGGKFSLHK
jgi:hypothetical protein